MHTSGTLTHLQLPLIRAAPSLPAAPARPRGVCPPPAATGQPNITAPGRVHGRHPAVLRDRQPFAANLGHFGGQASAAIGWDAVVMFGEVSHDDLWALCLSLLAGLSTSVGGVLAVIKRPDEGLLAFLLGIAIGVMASLSVLEMYLRNALEHGFLYVTISVALGAAAFYFANPYFPEFDPASLTGEQAKDDKLDKHDSSPRKTKAGSLDVESAELSKVKSTDDSTSSMVNTGGQNAVQRGPIKRTVSAGPGKGNSSTEDQGRGAGQIPPAELLRLGLLMAVTMTIHNCPEGFAVAFAANTEIGVSLTTAIAIHNIPEGIIVAAPVYAATGNRWMAVGIATVSGLSEPLGALVALLFIRPFLSVAFLNYMIGFVGGIMLAVCIVELWPEARKCQADMQLAQGCVLGAVVMLWTLHMGV